MDRDAEATGENAKAGVKATRGSRLPRARTRAAREQREAVPPPSPTPASENRTDQGDAGMGTAQPQQHSDGQDNGCSGRDDAGMGAAQPQQDRHTAALFSADYLPSEIFSHLPWQELDDLVRQPELLQAFGAKPLPDRRVRRYSFVWSNAPTAHLEH